jgi:hypothetical protein
MQIRIIKKKENVFFSHAEKNDGFQDRRRHSPLSICMD